ncbi:pilus assembly protein N-terminal domain-containing protein [Dongia sp.]|uniref:pilus assembly protein N-terminal domain-containing protein n=1 Tax=Dongia sp. TaxID=1977262 RepID=UPI0035AE1D6B
MRRALVLATFTALTLALVGVGSKFATANDAVQVTWRKAQIMSFGPGVSGIIIGDPSVIDVTLEGSGQIVVFGKVPGETNMMVLGADNSVLFDAPIVVMPEDDRHVSIISPGDAVVTERSWNCLSRCVQVLGPGSIRYSSVRPAGGGSSAAPGADAGAGGASGDASAAAAAAAGQTAQDVSNMNKATSQGAGGVAGQTGLVAPY